VVAGWSAVFRLQARYFFLSCQEESTQEEGASAASPGVAGCSALLVRNGGLRNSGLRPSDSPRPFSRCALCCSTTQRARGKPIE